MSNLTLSKWGDQNKQKRKRRERFGLDCRKKEGRVFEGEINRWMKEERKGTKTSVALKQRWTLQWEEVQKAHESKTHLSQPEKKKGWKKRSGGGRGGEEGGGLSASELQPMQWEMGQAGTERRCYCHSHCLPGPRVPPNDREMARIAAASTTGTYTQTHTPEWYIGTHTHTFIYICLSN